MASKRERILSNIVTTLGAITTGGGYNFSVGQATLGLKHFSAIAPDKFPAACVSGADEDRRNITNMEFKSDIIASIVAYVKVTDSADTEQLEKDVSKLIEDFTKALYVDITRGGYATVTEVRQVDTDKGAWVPYAGFEMQVRCEYRSAVTAP